MGCPRCAFVLEARPDQVEIIFIQSGTLITMGVVSGELNFSGAGAASVVAARLKGGDVVYWLALWMPMRST